MRWAVGVIVTLCILLAAYFASPLIAMYRIAAAVEARDAVALTERIEFPAVRRSLTKQIVAAYLTLTGKKLPIGAIPRRFAVSVADPIVARLMTVRALLDLLGKGDARENMKGPSDRAPFTPASFKSVWQLWLSSEYLGRDFYVYLPPKKARREQFEVHLRPVQWRWKIVGLGLPEKIQKQLARDLVELIENRLKPNEEAE
jgi:hypothetical protein